MDPNQPTQPNTENNSKQKIKLPPKKIIIAGLVAIVVIAILTFAALKIFKSDEQPQAASSTALVSITDDGFMPSTITIKKGDQISWTNETQTGRRIAAEPYPTGESLPGLDSGESAIEPGATYVFKFDNAGTFNYYDYADPTKIKAIVIVE